MPKIKQAEFRLEPKFYSKNFLNKARITLEKLGFSLTSGPNTSIGAAPLIQPRVLNPTQTNSINNTITGPNLNPSVTGRQNITPLLASGVNVAGANFQSGPLQTQIPQTTTTEFDENVRQLAMNLKGGNPASRQPNTSTFQFMSAPALSPAANPNVSISNGKLTYQAPRFPPNIGTLGQKYYEDTFRETVMGDIAYLLRHYSVRFYKELGSTPEHEQQVRRLSDIMDDGNIDNAERVKQLIIFADNAKNSPLRGVALRIALSVAGTMDQEDAQELAKIMLNNGMTDAQVQEFFETAHNWVQSIYNSVITNADKFEKNYFQAMVQVTIQSIIPQFRGGLRSNYSPYATKIGDYIGADHQIQQRINNLDWALLARAMGARPGAGAPNAGGAGANAGAPNAGGAGAPNAGAPNAGGGAGAPNAPQANLPQSPSSAPDDAEWAWRRFNTAYRQTPSYMPFSQHHQQIHRGIGDVLRSNNMQNHQKAWWLLTYGNMAYATRNPMLAQFAYQTGMYFVGKLNDNEANQFKNMLKTQGFNDNQINMFFQQARAFAALMDDRAERRGIEEQGWYATDHAYPLYYGADWDWFNQFNRANRRKR
jgi:methylphosphotriester-DNA--protein-cysteine methyltransferase